MWFLSGIKQTGILKSSRSRPNEKSLLWVWISNKKIDKTTNLMYSDNRKARRETKDKMKRTFIEVPVFTKKWKELGLTDENLRELQNILLENPKAGDAIQGTGGLRKIRIPIDQHGKRGGGRVIYVDIELKETIYFINVYTKNEKDDLTEEEKKAFKAVVKILKEE